MASLRVGDILQGGREVKLVLRSLVKPVRQGGPYSLPGWACEKCATLGLECQTGHSTKADVEQRPENERTWKRCQYCVAKKISCSNSARLFVTRDNYTIVTTYPDRPEGPWLPTCGYTLAQQSRHQEEARKMPTFSLANNEATESSDSEEDELDSNFTSSAQAEMQGAKRRPIMNESSRNTKRRVGSATSDDGPRRGPPAPDAAVAPSSTAANGRGGVRGSNPQQYQCLTPSTNDDRLRPPSISLESTQLHPSLRLDGQVQAAKLRMEAYLSEGKEMWTIMQPVLEAYLETGALLEKETKENDAYRAEIQRLQKVVSEAGYDWLDQSDDDDDSSQGSRELKMKIECLELDYKHSKEEERRWKEKYEKLKAKVAPK